MGSKYFTVEVKPDIPVVDAGQNTAFADGDVLFDWQHLQMLKGGGKLIGAHVEIRPKGDAGATPNKFPLELLFARNNHDHPDELARHFITTLGAVNTAPANSGNISTTIGKFVGQVPIVAGDFADSIDPIAIASTSDTNGIVLQQAPGFAPLKSYPGGGTFPSPGYSQFFISGIAGGALDFRSATLINNGDLNGPILTVNGTSPILHIVPGDTVAVCTAADNTATKAMGEVESLSSTTVVLTEAFTTADVVDGDIVYNKNPIRILLTFER